MTNCKPIKSPIEIHSNASEYTKQSVARLIAEGHQIFTHENGLIFALIENDNGTRQITPMGCQKCDQDHPYLSPEGEPVIDGITAKNPESPIDYPHEIAVNFWLCPWCGSPLRGCLPKFDPH